MPKILLFHDNSSGNSKIMAEYVLHGVVKFGANETRLLSVDDAKEDDACIKPGEKL